MSFTKQQIKDMVRLKGEGLFPSKIADTFGLPRGSVKKFFKERRRAAERGLDVVVEPVAAMEPVFPIPPEWTEPVLDYHDYATVKQLRADGVPLRSIAEMAGAGDTYNKYRSWYAWSVGRDKDRKKRALDKELFAAPAAEESISPQIAVYTSSYTEPAEEKWGTPDTTALPPVAKRSYKRKVEILPLTPHQLAQAETQHALGTHWHDIAYLLGVPIKALQTWRMRKIKDEKRAVLQANAERTAAEERQEQQEMPVHQVTASYDDMLAAAGVTIDDAVHQAAMQAAEPDLQLVAYAWEGYMHANDVGVIGAGDVAELLNIYNQLKGGTR